MTTPAPRCWQRIATDSPLYLRRLAREIRRRCYSGVYASFTGGARDRIINARYGKAGLLVKTMAGGWKPYIYVTSLDNGAGDHVTASTTVCGR
jgi:hypothetical protein